MISLPIEVFEISTVFRLVFRKLLLARRVAFAAPSLPLYCFTAVPSTLADGLGWSHLRGRLHPNITRQRRRLRRL
jgi:hypothetical protein